MIQRVARAIAVALTIAFAAPGLAIAFAAPAARAAEPLATHMTPQTQPPVEAIAGRDLAPVHALFNRDADRPRVLVLLSPT